MGEHSLCPGREVPRHILPLVAEGLFKRLAMYGAIDSHHTSIEHVYVHRSRTNGNPQWMMLMS